MNRKEPLILRVINCYPHLRRIQQKSVSLYLQSNGLEEKEIINRDANQSK